MKTNVAIIGLVCLFCSCNAVEQQTPPLRRVQLTRPVRSSEFTEKYFSGVVREAREINLGFKTPGQIERLYVKEGDYIRQGQLIAELDDADYRLGVEALKVQYNQLNEEVARMEQLFKQNSLSANDFEKATSGLRQLKIQLQTQKNKLDYTKLYAPVDGYVHRINFEKAEMVDAGTPLISLLDVSHMEVVVDIPSGYFIQQDRFSQFVCRSEFLPNKEIPLTLLSITPKADGNQLYSMRLLFNGSKQTHHLTAGMNVEVGITMTDDIQNGTCTLPLRTVFKEGSNSYVWVLQSDSTVIKRKVELTGINSEGNVIVSSGLEGSEEVIRAGVNALRENQKVRVVDSIDISNVGGLL